MRFYFLLTCALFLANLNLHSQCMAGFTFADNGLTIQFTDASIGGGSPITNWSWNFDDGSTSSQQNPTHVFPEADNYNVCLTITTQNGCSDQFCFEVTICTLLMSATVNPNCDPNRQITVNVTISDPFGEANSINVTFDGVLVPGSPFDTNDNAPVIIVRPLILFPNPATSDDASISLLGIDPGDYGNVGRIKIIGMRGEIIGSQEVICEEQIVFTLGDHLPDGIYFVELSTGRNVYTGKLMMNYE